MPIVYAISPNLTYKSIDALPVGGGGASNGNPFAIPNYYNDPLGLVVTWRCSYGAVPASTDVRLQGTIRDAQDPATVDADWFDLDNSTNVNGAQRQVNNVKVKYIRARRAAQAGAGDLTVEIMI